MTVPPVASPTTSLSALDAAASPGPRKFVFLTDIVTPYMASVFEALADQVDLTVLFCSRSGTRGTDWSFADGLAFPHRILEGLTIRRRSADATDYYLSPRIPRALFELRPDVVISSGYSIPSAYAALYCKLTGSGLVLQSDGTSFSERNFGRAQLFARRFLMGLDPCCVANSELAAERFLELGVRPQRLFRAPHSTNLARFWAVADGRPAERERVTVLSVGRFIPRKGVNLLVDAFARAVAVDPRLRLVLVGNGPEEDALRAQARRLGVEVEFRGFVDQPQLPALYAEADVFAFPTLDDPFGLVLLEAAAAGLPAIASPHGGATFDLIDEGETGYAIEPTDLDGWAEALVRLAQDAELRTRLGANAHRRSLGRTPAASAAGYVAAGRAAFAS
jgi:glycosyltransferase involved in cell wall biosynthesis